MTESMEMELRRKTRIFGDPLFGQAADRIEQLERQLAEAKQDAGRLKLIGYMGSGQLEWIEDLMGPQPKVDVAQVWLRAEQQPNATTAIYAIPAMQAKEPT